MNLVIHDMDEKEWEKYAPNYENWKVVSADDHIRPCAGCFGCWLKTPGQCVIKDGFDQMPSLIHEADEVVIISKYSYGGFSSSVKNILDRSIGYILPFFRIVNGQMHHKLRYHEDKAFSFIFRGSSISKEDKEKARKYVEAACISFGGQIKEIRFDESDDSNIKSDIEESNMQKLSENKGTVFLNCSMRGDNSNSRKFLDVVAKQVKGDIEHLNISSYLNNMSDLVKIILSSQNLVLGMPLYVDGIPSTPLKMMELIERECALNKAFAAGTNIYVVANMGFYESVQISNLLSMVRSWCQKCGLNYCGGIAIGAGEMMGQVLGYGSNGPGKYVYDDLIKIGEAVNVSGSIGDIYTKANKFPRIAYFMAGNMGLKKSAKKNGLTVKEVLKQ